MNDPATVLIILLSVILVCFFVAVIILVVELIKVTKQLRSIAEDVEVTTSKMRQLAENVAKVSSPVFIGKALMNLFKVKKKG